jgi:dephospho-CoA kinase
MFILMLTGGLGAGKSTASAFFRQRGAAILDLDKIASHLLVPGSSTLGAVVEEFGRKILNEDGTLNRERLAELAFGRREDVARLNAIVHPAVARELGPSLTEIRLLPNQPTVTVVEVPLLAEAPVFAQMADEVLAIEAPEELRVQRAVGRGIDEAEARRRIALQASDEERADLADAVIVNAGSREDFERDLDDYWERRVVGREAGTEAQ